MDKFKCRECKYQAKDSEDLKKHLRNEHVNKQILNCTRCQNSCSEVNENKEHSKTLYQMEGTLKCKICGTEFLTKPQLMRHRKLEHPNTVAPCKKYLVGQCDYEFCWWIHKDGKPAEIECFFL